MNLTITIFLYLLLALELYSVLAAVKDAKAPRETVTPDVGCAAAGILIVAATPVALLLMTDQTVLNRALTVWLALGLLYSTAQLVRQAHGVRGERTPLSTTLSVFHSLANAAVVLYLILKG